MALTAGAMNELNVDDAVCVGLRGDVQCRQCDWKCYTDEFTRLLHTELLSTHCRR